METAENDEAYAARAASDATRPEDPGRMEGGRRYTLELPARCPHCREIIRTIRVLRLKRTQVTFTSTLPRGGRVIVCPQCERIISAELTTL